MKFSLMIIGKETYSIRMKNDVIYSCKKLSKKGNKQIIGG